VNLVYCVFDVQQTVKCMPALGKNAMVSSKYSQNAMLNAQ
jgi:hypothetical protein